MSQKALQRFARNGRASSSEGMIHLELLHNAVESIGDVFFGLSDPRAVVFMWNMHCVCVCDDQLKNADVPNMKHAVIRKVFA